MPSWTISKCKPFFISITMKPPKPQVYHLGSKKINKAKKYHFWRIVVYPVIWNFTRSLNSKLNPCWNRVFKARWSIHTYLNLENAK